MADGMKKPALAGTRTGTKHYMSTKTMSLMVGALNALCKTTNGGVLSWAS